MELDRPSMPMQVDAREKPRSMPNTRLHGPWLILARAAWIIVVALSLAVSIADIPLEYARLHTVCVGSSCEQQLTVGIVQDLHHLNLSVDFFATFLVMLEFGSLFVWSAIALVIFWRRSNDRVALLVALFLVLFPTEQGLGSPDAVGAAYPSLQALTNVLGVLGGLSFLLFLYLFPDGRFIPHWTRIFFLAFILLNMVGDLFPTTPLGEALSSFLGLTLLAIAVGIGLVAQVYRYRRVSSPVHYFTRNRTRRSDFPPFLSSLGRSRRSFPVAFVCVSGRGRGLIFVIGRVRFLVKPPFSAGSLLV